MGPRHAQGEGPVPRSGEEPCRQREQQGPETRMDSIYQGLKRTLLWGGAWE